MCGRYAISVDSSELIEQFDVDIDATGESTRSILATPQNPPAGSPDFNMAPTKQAPVILMRKNTVTDGGAWAKQLRHLTWGLVPSWSKDAQVGVRMINARAETVLEKPAFAKAAATRRLLVPASGWYEWQISPVARDAKGKPRKQPFFMRRRDDEPLAFAGIYDFWRDRSLPENDPDAWLATFSIITTSAGPGLERIHDRQPLNVERKDWADWLNPDLTDPGDVQAFLHPGDSEPFEAYPVSSAVSFPRNNGASLIEPIPESDLDGVVDPMTGEIIGGLDLGLRG